MDLTHAGFGHPEDLADLGEGQSLEVVEGDDDLLALRQVVDRVREQPSRLVALHPGGRIDALVGERIEQRDLLAAIGADRDHLVQRQHRDERDLVHNVVQLGEAHPEPLRELGLRGCALEHRLEVAVGLLDLPCLEPNRSRDPVHRAQLVDDRAADPGDRVRLELVPPARLELLQPVDQTEHPVAHEIRLLDAGGQTGGDLARHVLDERCVVQDQALARLGRRRLLEVVPQGRERIELLRRGLTTRPSRRGRDAGGARRRGRCGCGPRPLGRIGDLDGRLLRGGLRRLRRRRTLRRLRGGLRRGLRLRRLGGRGVHRGLRRSRHHALGWLCR